MWCSRSASPVRSAASSAALGAAVLVGVPAGPVVAVGSERPVTARCTFQYSPAISPGIGLETSAGQVSSGGESGTADCTGSLDGHRITGQGSWGFEGLISEANCTEGGRGTGRALLTVPTDAGSRHFEEAIAFTFGPAGGYPPLVGDWVGSRSNGLFAVVPSEGDCITAPVTRVDANGQFTLRG